MSDIRSLDLEQTNYGLNTSDLFRNFANLTAGSANNAEYFGFFVGTVGGAWSITPIDSKVAVSFTPVAGKYYPFHVSSITPDAGGTGQGNLGGYKHELVDPIDSMTVDDATVANGLITGVAGASPTLTSASSVLPVVGNRYKYEIVVDAFTNATTATIGYGNNILWSKAGAGTFSGELTANIGNGLTISSVNLSGGSWIISKLSVKRL